MKKNVLIIGAGLAGLTLAYQFKKKGINFLLLDKGENFSSAIAAGLVNPMVFRRMNKSWRIDEFLPFATSFYKELESFLGIHFFNPITIQRCFSSLQEKKWWAERCKQNEYASYLGSFYEEDPKLAHIHCENGFGKVNAAFWVNANLFIEKFQQFYISNSQLIYQEFNPNNFNTEKLIYNGNSYDAVVFCAGFLQKNMPFFENIPIQQTKGQIMTVDTNELPQNVSLNRKCFILPIGNNQFKVGATYEWHNNTTHTSEEGLKDLQQKLSNVFSGKYNVINQEAGIRPTVVDRRPVLGESIKYPNIYIFNGLGTKGYLMAPKLSEEMAEFIIYGKEPPIEYNSKRFS